VDDDDDVDEVADESNRTGLVRVRDSNRPAIGTAGGIILLRRPFLPLATTPVNDANVAMGTFFTDALPPVRPLPLGGADAGRFAVNVCDCNGGDGEGEGDDDDDDSNGGGLKLVEGIDVTDNNDCGIVDDSDPNVGDMADVSEDAFDDTDDDDTVLILSSAGIVVVAFNFGGPVTNGQISQR
jgi:hypothetical protein